MGLIIFILGLVIIWLVATGRFQKTTNALFHAVPVASAQAQQ